jgi:hypothetical protein
MTTHKRRPARGGVRDPWTADRLNTTGQRPEPEFVTELSQPRGGRPRPLESLPQTTLPPARIAAKTRAPAPGKPAGGRACRKCGRTDRKFSGRHKLCNDCRTTTTARWCECGALLGRYQRKCDTCLLVDHRASSQCPFCSQWYWTHRGLGIDQSEMKYHAQARCIKRFAG